MAAGKGMRDVAVTERRYRGEDRNYKKVKVYPTLTLELEDVPELKSKKYDQECMLLVRAKVLNVGTNSSRYIGPGEEKPKPKIELEIRSVKPYAGGNPGKGDDGYEPKKDGY